MTQRVTRLANDWSCYRSSDWPRSHPTPGLARRCRILLRGLDAVLCQTPHYESSHSGLDLPTPGHLVLFASSPRFEGASRPVYARVSRVHNCRTRSSGTGSTICKRQWMDRGGSAEMRSGEAVGRSKQEREWWCSWWATRAQSGFSCGLS